MCIKRMEQRQKMLLFKLLSLLLLLLLLSSFVKKTADPSGLPQQTFPHLGHGQAYDGVVRFWINYF